jgi:hypothetical protein
MNILSELLAGARQIRTPLAVGYVWLLVAWVNATRAPATTRHAVLITRATQGLKDLSPVVVIVIISCLAYLLGLFFELFDDFLVKLGVTIVAGLMLVALVIFVLIAAFAFWPLTLALIVFTLLGFVLSVRGKTDRIEASTRRFAFHIFLFLSAYAYRLRGVVRRIWSSASPVRNDLVAESVIKLLDEHPEALNRFFETLSIHSLRVTCDYLVRGVAKSGSEFRGANGEVTNMSKIVTQSPMDSAGAQLMRDYLAQRCETSREIQKTVVIRAMNLSDVRDLVNRAIDDAVAHIQAKSPDVFDSYDRLRSESELRRGVSVPLGVALFSAASFFSSHPALMAIVSIPAIFVYFSGMKKQEEATSIIVRSIAAQITPVSLNVNDIRLLSWPIQGPVHELKIVSALRSRIRQVGSNDKIPQEVGIKPEKNTVPDA